MRSSGFALLALLLLPTLGHAGEPYTIDLDGANARGLENILLGNMGGVSWKEGKKSLAIELRDIVCVEYAYEPGVHHCSHQVDKPKTLVQLIQKLFGKHDPTPEELIAKGFTKKDFRINAEYSGYLAKALVALGVEAKTENLVTTVRAEKIECTSHTEKEEAIPDAWKNRKDAFCTITVDPDSSSPYLPVMTIWWTPANVRASDVDGN